MANSKMQEKLRQYYSKISGVEVKRLSKKKALEYGFDNVNAFYDHLAEMRSKERELRKERKAFRKVMKEETKYNKVEMKWMKSEKVLMDEINDKFNKYVRSFAKTKQISVKNTNSKDKITSEQYNLPPIDELSDNNRLIRFIKSKATKSTFKKLLSKDSKVKFIIHEKDNETKGISTPYYKNVTNAIEHIEQLLVTFAGRYDGGEDVYSSRFRNPVLVIQFFTPNPLAGQGSNELSLQYNKTHKTVSVKSRTNCLYNAYTIATHTEDYDKFVDDATGEIKDYLYEVSKKLKFRLDGKSGVKKLVSDEEELQKLADYGKRNIIIHNNACKVIKEYKPSAKLDKRTKEREPVELKLVNGHFMTMIRRDKLPKQHQQDVIVTKADDDELIYKRSFATPYNKKYAAYDIETTQKGDENTPLKYSKAYAVGFSWNENNEIKHVQFWGMDCQMQFLTFLCDNLDKFKNYTVYAHNGKKFDYINLMREALLDETSPLKLVHGKTVELNGGLISFSVTDGSSKLHFRDSSCIFAGQSLKSITTDLKVQHQKLDELVNHDQIYLSNYDKIPELKTYLEYDCTGLLECINKFSHQVHTDTEINLSDIFTGATLSKKYFYKKFYSAKFKPIYFMTKDKDKFVRDSYMGGRNECFHIGHLKGKLYYYDFTSLFPSVGRNKLPYGKPQWVTLNNANDFSKFYGFTEVYVKTVDFSAKPIHGSRDNRLVFQHFKEFTKMTLFSEEIRLGMSKGVYEYKFEDCKALKFDAGYILKQFFEQCVDKKAEAKKAGNDALALSYKIIANSGYGFWGLNATERDSVVISDINSGDHYQYLFNDKLVNYTEFGNYMHLRVKKDLDMKDFNVSIAAAITSYARMKLWSLINDIEKVGHKVYYCDTDSVITSCDLTKYEEIRKVYQWDGTGDELGSLKNECVDKIKKVFSNQIEDVKKNDKLSLSEKEYQISNIKQQQIQVTKDQYIKDDGDLCFDEVVICGLKFYACKKTLVNDVSLEITKLKGYKQSKGNELEFDTFVKLNNKELPHIDQDQVQFNIPKSAWVCSERKFGLTIKPIHKKFMINYTKGNVNSDGSITPFIV